MTSPVPAWCPPGAGAGVAAVAAAVPAERLAPCRARGRTGGGGADGGAEWVMEDQLRMTSDQLIGDQLFFQQLINWFN